MRFPLSRIPNRPRWCQQFRLRAVTHPFSVGKAGCGVRVMTHERRQALRLPPSRIRHQFQRFGSYRCRPQTSGDRADGTHVATTHDAAPAEQRKGHQMTILDRFGRPKEVPAGYILQEGESQFGDLGSMHLPANTRRMGDAALATFIRDGGTANAAPAGFFRDSYGRLLPCGRSPERDRVEGVRIATEAMLSDAWRSGDARPDTPRSREQYVADLANAWKAPESA